jgi:hypothetical protein
VKTFSCPTFDENGDPIDHKCRFPSMVTSNIDYLQQWYRTVDDPYYVCIWFTLQDSNFTAWKRQSLHEVATSPIDTQTIEVSIDYVYKPSPTLNLQSKATIQNMEFMVR